jgi:hypothetical protein
MYIVYNLSYNDLFGIGLNKRGNYESTFERISVVFILPVIPPITVKGT